MTNNMTNNEVTTPAPAISPEALALLGGGKIAYVKAIRSEEVSSMFPQALRIAVFPGDPFDIVGRIAIRPLGDAVERTLDLVESKQKRTGQRRNS